MAKGQTVRNYLLQNPVGEADFARLNAVKPRDPLRNLPEGLFYDMVKLDTNIRRLSAAHSLVVQALGTLLSEQPSASTDKATVTVQTAATELAASQAESIAQRNLARIAVFHLEPATLYPLLSETRDLLLGRLSTMTGAEPDFRPLLDDSYFYSSQAQIFRTQLAHTA